jgi:GT2 family glycosyltransferase/glycosyltransferase involved in cell wall biosynthesis
MVGDRSPEADGSRPGDSSDQLRRELEEVRHALAGIQGSTTFRAAAAVSRVATRLLPPSSRRRAAVERLLRGDRSETPSPPSGPVFDRRLMRQRLAASATRDPQRFAIIVLPGDDRRLQTTLASVRAQSWPWWEVTALVPGGTSHASGHGADERLRLLSSADPRSVDRVLEELPPRALVLFLLAGDALAPDCLYEVAVTVRRDPFIDLITWDDEVTEWGHGRPRLRLRPWWSPRTLVSANYLDRSFAIRASRVPLPVSSHGSLGPAQIWDLLLGCDIAGDRVASIPRTLSTAAREYSLARDAAAAVVDAALRRRGWPARARSSEPGGVRVEWALDRWPTVSVVIPTRHNRRLLGPLLSDLAHADYPSLEVIVADNGGRSPDNERWYETQPLRPTILWWERPFNYSAVNNAAARRATGEVLLFLNDDIRAERDPAWLKEMVGWLTVSDVGAVGMQLLDDEGRIQHGGVILGLTGFAGHLFAGTRPGCDTLLGSTTWNRDVLAVTAACLAVRRVDFEGVGGFDESFTLCGSDVALCLALRERGLGSVCLPNTGLTHLESATRGRDVPANDFFVSWWRYQRWIRSGDPYYNPRLSMTSTSPRLKAAHEPSAAQLASPYIGRSVAVFHSRDDLPRAGQLARQCRISPQSVRAVREVHRRAPRDGALRSVNWYIPGIDSPFYGGIYTALRIAAKLAGDHGVENRFVVCGGGPAAFIESGISAAFPILRDSPVVIADTRAALMKAPPADAAIATLWTTAYDVAKYGRACRKYYLVQDFEPMFYPAGTIYALAEESYRLGLYGLCNTANLASIYRSYGGVATHFVPAVNGEVFHAAGRRVWRRGEPITLFVYARPGHWRNCWELAEPALMELKDQFADGIRILAAGSWSVPPPSHRMPAITHLGLLDYAETGRLYRRCDIGLALTVSEHPSYLPLELMACGVGVVAFDNPAGSWLLRDGENCLLAPRTVDGLVDRVQVLVRDAALRERLVAQGLEDIAARHADWDRALAGVHAFLSNPEGGQTTSAPGGGHSELGRRAQRRPPLPVAGG